MSSTHTADKPLPLRTINRLEEGDTIEYRPLAGPNAAPKGDIALVLVPANKAGAGKDLLILDPKSATKPQQWKVPWRVSVVAFVYGPQGLSTRKVRNFLSRDDELVGELADYAETTAKTEALIAALSSPANSSQSVQAALEGFSLQTAPGGQITRNTPANQQAVLVLQTLGPALATYDPLSPQGARPAGQTASLATSVAEMFFGSPVGLAAGGTAMLLNLRAVAFPRTEFRSSFSQALPDDGLGLCAKHDPPPPHTKLAYLWATRVPNVGPPHLTVDKNNSLPLGVRSPLPVASSDDDWKYLDRARNWVLQPASGKPVPIKIQKRAGKRIQLDLTQNVKPGAYTLAATWDWDHFQTAGHIDVRPLSDFARVHLAPASQDLLVTHSGKTVVTLEGSDFEFLTKVEIEKLNDEFAMPAAVPFVLPRGLREGPQPHVDMQVNTADLDAGAYKLILSQVDGKQHDVKVQVLPPLPSIGDFPVVLNQGSATAAFELKGHRLDLLKSVDPSRGTAELGPASADGTERALTLHLPSGLHAGTDLALTASIRDRSKPMMFPGSIRVVGSRPRIAELTVSQPPDEDVQLQPGELPGETQMSALMRFQPLHPDTVLRLGCEQPGTRWITLKMGQGSGSAPVMQQLTSDEVYFAFDTGTWFNGCRLEVEVDNGGEGSSQPYKIGRVVRLPHVSVFTFDPDYLGDGFLDVVLTGRNLETIDKLGWTATHVDASAGLPLPVPGHGPQQKLEVHMPPPPDPNASLFVWLRGESQPRATTLQPAVPPQ